MRNWFKCLFVAFGCLLATTGFSINDTTELSKNSFGINFLRVTHLDISDYNDDFANPGLSSLLGLTYQYQINPNTAIRFAVHKDRKYYRYTGWGVFEGAYSNITCNLGIQVAFKSKIKSPLYILVDVYAKKGSGYRYYNAVSIRPTGGGFNDFWNRPSYASYTFREIGGQIGIGKAFYLSKQISLNLESTFMLGENRSTHLESSYVGIQNATQVNPISRCSINYRFNQKKSQHLPLPH
ncbi:MAG: hypothetical protein ACI8SE_000503 [Bacteroidia bacterium]